MATRTTPTRAAAQTAADKQPQKMKELPGEGAACSSGTQQQAESKRRSPLTTGVRADCCCCRARTARVPYRAGAPLAVAGAAQPKPTRATGAAAAPAAAARLTVW